MKVDRFSLESKILDFSKVLDDIDIVVRMAEQQDSERVQRTLIGIRELYDQKFEDLWETFEKLIHDKKII